MRFSVSLDTAEIPRLFDRFVSIVGSEPWLKRVRTLRQQIAANPLLGPFFQERYPLELAAGHLLELRRETGQLRIQVNELGQYRLFSFVAPLVQIYDGLSEAGRSRLAGMLLDGLKSDRGLAPLQPQHRLPDSGIPREARLDKQRQGRPELAGTGTSVLFHEFEPPPCEGSSLFCFQPFTLRTVD